jgi:hypothetical protein
MPVQESSKRNRTEAGFFWQPRKKGLRLIAA